MDSILGTLLLVLPGFVAYYISRKLGPTNPRVVTDFERTVSSLLFNVPGVLIIWAGVALGTWKILSIKQFLEYIQMMPNIVFYLAGSIITSVSVAYWWNKKWRTWSLNLIGKVRGEQGRPNEVMESPWEYFFGSEESVLLAVYPLGERGKFVFGELTHSFLPGDVEKGIVLINTSEYAPWFEYMDSPVRTFLDINNKLVYELYPTSTWLEVKRRVEEEHMVTSLEVEE